MKKIICTVFVFLLIVLSNTYCQVKFQCAIGGIYSQSAYDIIQTTDGGYVVAGSTSSFGAGNEDMYVVKLNANGAIQWTKTIGGSGVDCAFSIIQTTDGGYAVAGCTYSYGAGSQDMYIVKLNSIGGLQWSKTIGGTGTDAAYSIVQTSDGGYALGGYTQSFGAGLDDFFLVKLSSTGTFQWGKTVGGSQSEEAFSLVKSNDGGYAIAGHTHSFGMGAWDYYIVKFDANGTFQWNKTIGDTNTEYCKSMIQTRDGGYAMTGYIIQNTPQNYNYIYNVKLDAGGALQWTAYVSTGITHASLTASSIIQTIDNGYAIGGFHFVQSLDSSDMFVAKLNNNGASQWCKTFGGNRTDYGESIIQTSDSGYALTGFTSSFGLVANIYVAKLDANFNSCGIVKSLPVVSATGGTLMTPTPTVTSPTPTVTTPASIVGSGGTYVSICNSIGVKNQEGEIPEKYILFQNFPNPFNPSTIIKFMIAENGKRKIENSLVTLKVYDMTGREIATLVNEKLSPGIYEVPFSINQFSNNQIPSGVYFYKLSAGDPEASSVQIFTETMKMLLIK